MHHLTALMEWLSPPVTRQIFSNFCSLMCRSNNIIFHSCLIFMKKQRLKGKRVCASSILQIYLSRANGDNHIISLLWAIIEAIRLFKTVSWKEQWIIFHSCTVDTSVEVSLLTVMIGLKILVKEGNTFDVKNTRGHQHRNQMNKGKKERTVQIWMSCFLLLKYSST